ncbi:hypothetical protein DPEC_G00060200 [Dallia pectoralis]|uniref:Uncharacterized protein n=1 Tax=Dallia pectoralis TaxID=75939 RepID=A0ACC2H6L3_DALPE|nr:hypothetical protein DPEC_G00060200 [Dallia pectoralis]
MSRNCGSSCDSFRSSVWMCMYSSGIHTPIHNLTLGQLNMKRKEEPQISSLPEASQGQCGQTSQGPSLPPPGLSI